jgi:molybdenum cofactor cytidylyltransferase
MIGAIVLAAGRSRRMGTQKLLLPWAGQTVIGHIVDQVLAAGVNQVWVVVGADREAVSKALENRLVKLVTNPDPDAEMLSSVRCGLRALSPECEAAMIVLGDQPGILTSLISTLIAKFQQTKGGIITPIHNEKGGHPLIISSQYFHEVLHCFEGIGLAGLLAAHAEAVHQVQQSDAAVLLDIDYPQDYEQALAAQRAVAELPSQAFGMQVE